jgi:glutathione S-transferase
VPVISDDGVVVFESPAIALYLTDKFPQWHLGPRAGDPGRGPYLSWLSYYSAVLEPAFVSKFMKHDVPRGTAGWVAVEEAMPAVLKQLGRGPYLLGEQFTALDVLYGTTFAMFGQSPVLPKSAQIEDYAQRVVARPAFKRALAREGG